MSFNAIVDELHNTYERLLSGSRKGADIAHIINRDRLRIEDLFSLLSVEDPVDIESMAQRARDLTIKNFGRTVSLYTPLYLSNYCENHCIYCGFNASSGISRMRLTVSQLEKEAEHISSSGLKHILVLTGESKRVAPVEYILECIDVLKRYFSSISIEIYPLSGDEYADVVSSGADGLTIYQEVYNRDRYAEVHPSGPKRDYEFRIEAPERACENGMRFVNIGALLGLSGWKREAFLTALHAKYLQDRFPGTEVSVSVPRLRPFVAKDMDFETVSTADLVKIILALRIFLPRVGITLSTRESSSLRDNLLGLGITRMSAGSTTAVGGHTLSTEDNGNPCQFDIDDKRGVADIVKMLRAKGYQPVLKDWMRF